ncbi:MAG: radical SAM protein [Chloroflexi bacterium]|nr:radical SAM protein [Chloroflexota bacterium]
MNVVLTDNPTDLGKRSFSSHQDCACDCQCACPTDGAPIPTLSLPVAYYLELTPICDNRCPGCGNVYADARNENPISLNGTKWRNLIERLVPHTHQFKLTGGEPTLHPDFAEIVRTVEDYGIPFTLFTNGRWSDPEDLLRLLRDTTTCEGLLISLHGPDAATHESFSGVPGSFDETIANIRRATHAGLDVAISIVINRHNWDRVAETLDLALSLGANHVVCNRYISQDMPADSVSPSQVQLRAAITIIESLHAAGKPIRFGNCIPQCFQASSSRGCTAGSTFATIDPWGQMRPCNHAALIAGDLRTQSVQDVWQGETMSHWRSLVPPSCTVCSVFPTCHGGCRAQALPAEHAQDPLIRAPLVKQPSVPDPELLLYSGLRPMGKFTHRVESSGDVLIIKGQVVSVPADCKPLVPQLDGSLTLGQIERRYGHAAVNWIGALFQESMVTWVSST